MVHQPNVIIPRMSKYEKSFMFSNLKFDTYYTEFLLSRELNEKHNTYHKAKMDYTLVKLPNSGSK